MWKYFDAMAKEKTKCRLCGLELSYRGGTTSTMKNHLERRHKHISLLGARVHTQSKQTTLAAFKAPTPMSCDKYEQHTRKLALMCARDLRPLGIVEGEGFKEFVKSIAPTYTVPSRKTVKKYKPLL